MITIVRTFADQLFAFTNYSVEDQILHGALLLFAIRCGSYHGVHVHQLLACDSQWGSVV